MTGKNTPLPATMQEKQCLWIRIRIDLAVLDPDPDQGAWKLTTIKLTNNMISCLLKRLLYLRRSLCS
jgi:hypothetical protein